MNSINESDNQRALAWRVFFEVSGRLQGVLETRLKKAFGLSLADYNVLLALWEVPSHSLRMGQLAESVVYSPSRLTYLVTNLVHDGWVERVPSSTDRRSFEAILTPKGTETVLAASELHQATVREYLLDDVSDAAIDQIVSIFNALDKKLRATEN